MGITGLFQFVNSKEEAHFDVFMKDLSGKSLAIDTNGLCYVFSYQQDMESFLSSFLNLLEEFDKNNITPVFVFDGKPPQEKQETMNERSEAKAKFLNQMAIEKEALNKLEENAEKRALEETRSVEELKIEIYEKRKSVEKLENSRAFITDAHKNELWMLLYHLGYKCIRAHGEGESLCAMMTREKICDYSFSKDGDTLACGTPFLINGLVKSSERDKVPMRLYSLEKILNLFEFETLEDWIELCVLAPNDFNKKKRISGFGLIKGKDALLKHGTIEGLIENIIKTKSKTVIPSGYDPDEIRKQFYLYTCSPIFEYVKTALDAQLVEKEDKKKYLVELIKHYELKTMFKMSERLKKILFEKYDQEFDITQQDFSNLDFVINRLPDTAQLTEKETAFYNDQIFQKIQNFKKRKSGIAQKRKINDQEERKSRVCSDPRKEAITRLGILKRKIMEETTTTLTTKKSDI